MPPKGIPRPPQASIDALIAYVQSEFEKADAAIKPDPGRVVARRLNRTEYTNTIRDLLGVNFRADKDFPTDDSSYGFDDIAEALTVSPILIEKYLSAAEKIASAAIGADPLPKPITYDGRRTNRTCAASRPTLSVTTFRLERDAEYTVRRLVHRQIRRRRRRRSAGFWVDGKLLASEAAYRPRRRERDHTTEARFYVETGDHEFRAGLVGDNVPDPQPAPAGAGGPTVPKSLVVESISIDGPYPSKVERASRKKILICDPNIGHGVRGPHSAPTWPIALTAVPPTQARSGLSDALLSTGAAAGAERRSGHPAGDAVRSGVARFPVPHRARTGERRIHRISDHRSGFAAQLLPLEFDARRPVCWRLAEAGKLHLPRSSTREVTRMLADPKSSALAENFAGQWLEMRNLDEIHPDPVKFPEWSPDLRDAFKTETSHVLRRMCCARTGRCRDFIDARYTFVNELLAKHYGIPT